MSVSLYVFLVLWFISVAISLAYVIWHNLTSNPVSWVQKLAWILVTAYTGVIGLAAYWLTCRAPKGMDHEEFTKETWKQAVNSEMHCLAGDATGIILSAAFVYHLSLPNGIDLIIEYVSAFIVGLLIFQALMMIEMYEGDYLKAVRKTFFAETVSMNMVMVGMIPVMVLLMHHLPEGKNPYHPAFWFTMGLATIAGGITAYPINHWLLARNLKHGCMTIKPISQMEHHEHTVHGSHQMGEISFLQQIGWIVLTAALLLAVAYLTNLYAPIRFR